jgi:hypothetical protein
MQVDERLEHREGEDGDGDQPEQAELAEHHGEGVQEDHLDVEHDEDHGDQVEA